MIGCYYYLQKYNVKITYIIKLFFTYHGAGVGSQINIRSIEKPSKSSAQGVGRAPTTTLQPLFNGYGCTRPLNSETFGYLYNSAIMP